MFWEFFFFNLTIKLRSELLPDGELLLKVLERAPTPTSQFTLLTPDWSLAIYSPIETYRLIQLAFAEHLPWAQPVLGAGT